MFYIRFQYSVYFYELSKTMADEHRGVAVSKSFIHEGSYIFVCVEIPKLKVETFW